MELIKKSLLFIVLTTLISCSKYYSGDLKEYNLKGKVSSVKSVKFQALEKFGKVVKGKKTSRNQLDELDIQDSNISLLFDNNGKLEWLTYFDKYGDVELKATIKDTILNYYLPNGDLVLKCIDNDINLPTELCNYNSEGKLESKILMKYDNKKNLIEEKEYSKSGKLIKVSDYEYNENNYISKENRLEIRESYGYYSNRQDTIKSLLTFTYNDQNDIVEFIVLKNDEKEIKTYTYKYDENKNWIEKIEYNGFTPKYLIEREIDYLK